MVVFSNWLPQPADRMLDLKMIFCNNFSLALLDYSFFTTIYKNLFCNYITWVRFQLQLYWWELVEIYAESNPWLSVNKFQQFIYNYLLNNLPLHNHRQEADWWQSCRNQQPHFFHSVQMRTWSLPLSPQYCRKNWPKSSMELSHNDHLQIDFHYRSLSRKQQPPILQLSFQLILPVQKNVKGPWCFNLQKMEVKYVLVCILRGRTRQPSPIFGVKKHKCWRQRGFTMEPVGSLPPSHHA